MILETPLGPLTLTASFGRITGIWWPAHGKEGGPHDPILDVAAEQLRAYFGGATTFDLPLADVGTPFQKRVWAALCAIPYGETCSYAEIAEAIGAPSAVRAVARANALNPFSIVVPCHRVIGSDGALRGYAGGLPAKVGLLALERQSRAAPSRTRREQSRSEPDESASRAS
jgi:methylated-DNA-[protein]-cysteine S-methyltransferase